MTFAGELSLTLPELEDAGADGAAIESLVSAHSTLLFRVAHAILRDRAEAEDVVQESFVRVLQHKASLPDVRDARVWLVRIAWNLALDRKRRARPLQMDDAFALRLAGAEASADDALAAAGELRAVLEEMDRLPKGERHALLLSAVEEMSTQEIAAVLGKSESAVRALLFRARTRLRERVDKRLERRQAR
jgi:RNA polymerase sigma-70 factor (ECF subfamily)